MEIGPVNNNRPIQPSNEDDPKASTARKPGQVSQDRLEISESARLKLADLAEQAVRETEKQAPQVERTSKGPASSPDVAGHDRIEEIRRRVQNGFYERPDILMEIADRLSGDLDD